MIDQPPVICSKRFKEYGKFYAVNTVNSGDGCRCPVSIRRRKNRERNQAALPARQSPRGRKRTREGLSAAHNETEGKQARLNPFLPWTETVFSSRYICSIIALSIFDQSLVEVNGPSAILYRELDAHYCSLHRSDTTMNKLCIALRNMFHCTSPDIRGIAIDGVGITKEVAGSLRSVGFLGP